MTEDNKSKLTETTKTEEYEVLAVKETDINEDEEQYSEAEAELEEAQEEADIEQAAGPIAGINQVTFGQLTAKNQQFMINVDRYLVDELHYEVRTDVYREMVETLLEGQASSQTARQLYGTPSEVADSVLEQNLEPDLGEAFDTSPDWQIALDGGLLLGSVFTFLSGLSMLNTDPNADAAYMGVITLILNYVVAGVAMLYTAKNLPNPDAPKGEKGYPRYFAVSIGSMMLWFLAVSLSGAFLPATINPVLPATVYMVIGVATFALRFYLKRKLNIRGGVF